MDNILNREGIKDYSARVTNKLIGEFFSKKKKINGEEIKSLTDIKQVNLFIIKGLFEEWQKEREQLKSKFFDYDSEEVKSAMVSFMNVLSKNISISEKDFKPLLLHAIEESILLIFSPFDFYSHLSQHYSGSLSTDTLVQTGRYIKVNKNIMDALISKIEASPSKDISLEEYNVLLSEVLHEIESGPEDIDSFFDAFNKIESLGETDIYGEAQTSDAQPKDVVEQPAENEKADEPTAKAEEDNPTINEVLASTETTIGEALENKKLNNIKSSLSINQRFMFQNSLFSGDEETMNRTLDFIDNCQSKKEAMDYIYQEFPHWNIEGEEFEELVELIDKRLS